MEVVYYAACSLDGYIATADGGVEWLMPFQTKDEDYGFVEFNKSVDVILMGSRTYEFALSLPRWPEPGKPSWVFTERSLPVAHPTVTLTDEPPMTAVRRLRSEGCQRAWLMGGGALAASFERQQLISHYAISVIPVLLGSGIPLFGPWSEEHTLRLTATERYATGVVQLRYESTAP